MKVLSVLYEGFTEYEYQIPTLAFHHFGIPFESVGLDNLVVTGMIGLKASVTKTLTEVDAENYTALFLPGLDRSTREQVRQNEKLMALVRDFDHAKKLIAAACGAPALLGNAGVLVGRDTGRVAWLFHPTSRCSGPGIQRQKSKQEYMCCRLRT